MAGRCPGLRYRRAPAVVAATVLLAAFAFGARPAAASSTPVVQVLTMTPGPAVAERFGHTALRVGDRVYNFGTFEGDDPRLVRKFLGRELVYWLSVDSPEDHFERYANRTITIQELALTDAEAVLLGARLEDNARPERRAYRYDFFRDNCATRVRDAIDGIVGGGGVLRREFAAQPAARTFRAHVEHVLSPSPLLARAVSLLLGPYADAPTSRWDDAFLPSELAAILATAHRPDSAPLVTRTTVWVGPRVGEMEGRKSHAGEALLGVLLLAPLAGAVLVAGRPGNGRPRRLLAGAALAVFGLVGGVLGTAVLVAMLTPYACARGNQNLALLHPALLALVPLGVLVARGGRRALRAARLVLVASLAAAFGDLALRLLGLTRQHDLAFALVVAAMEAALLLASGGQSFRRAMPPPRGAPGPQDAPVGSDNRLA